MLLVSITVAGGLGCCAIIGIAFNASTTQIIPFLALGLGVNAMFLMTHTYAEICGSGSIPLEVSQDLADHGKQTIKIAQAKKRGVK